MNNQDKNEIQPSPDLFDDSDEYVPGTVSIFIHFEKIKC